MIRDDVLKEAADLIGGDRAQTYGDATASFARVGIIWGALLDQEPLTAAEVALCMTALKMVRLTGTSDHRDSWVDAAGYIALGAEAAAKGVTE